MNELIAKVDITCYRYQLVYLKPRSPSIEAPLFQKREQVAIIYAKIGVICKMIKIIFQEMHSGKLKRVYFGIYKTINNIHE